MVQSEAVAGSIERLIRNVMLTSAAMIRPEGFRRKASLPPLLPRCLNRHFDMAWPNPICFQKLVGGRRDPDEIGVSQRGEIFDCRRENAPRISARNQDV